MRWPFTVCQRLDYGEVQALRVGRVQLGVNTTFVVHCLGSTLVEAGPPSQASEVLAFAQQFGVRDVLVSHHHEDHSGGSKALQTAGLQVWAPPLALPYISHGFPVQFYRRAVWGKPPQCQLQSLPPRWRDRQNQEWVSLACPGHSPDMTCLWLPERGWLFGADLYVARRVRYGRLEDRLAWEVSSLNQILQLDWERFFCAHRGEVEQPRQSLMDKRDYFLELIDKVAQLAQRDYSQSQIQRKLLGREGMVRWLSGGHFCKSHLILACLKVTADQFRLLSRGLTLKPES